MPTARTLKGESVNFIGGVDGYLSASFSRRPENRDYPFQGITLLPRTLPRCFRLSAYKNIDIAIKA